MHRQSRGLPQHTDKEDPGVQAIPQEAHQEGEGGLERLSRRGSGLHGHS